VSPLRDQIRLVRWGELIVFGGALALLATAAWILLAIAHRCDERSAMFSPADAALEFERHALTPVVVPDATAAARGATIFRAGIGATGIVAVVWPSAEQQMLTDDARWQRRLTRGYERGALNVTFYALRGGSEADRSRVRAAIGSAVLHLHPIPSPSQCPPDE
jgi:hypothetical protein